MMTARERERLAVVRAIVAGRQLQREGAGQLGICLRQMKRLVRTYRGEGDRGLISRQRGRVSPLRLEARDRTRIVGFLSGQYEGFGPTLAAEKLAEREAIEVSRETIRRLQIEHKLWRPRRRKQKRVFQLRERRPRFGELIQIDGSPHDWFEACLSG